MITPANLVTIARHHIGPGDLTEFIVDKMPELLYKIERTGNDISHTEKDELIASMVLFLFAGSDGIDTDLEALLKEIEDVPSSS
jgi:hypothetical protein